MAANEEDLDLDVEAEEGGGKSKTLMIIVAGVVLLLTVSGAATFLLLGGENEPVAVEGTDGEGGDTEQQSAQPAKAKAPMTYMPLSPAFVVNFPPDSDIRFLQIDVQVGTRDPAMLDGIKATLPAIRNDLVILFSSQDPSTLTTREGKEKLRADSLEVVKKVLKSETGRANVEKIYFTSFVMQ